MDSITQNKRYLPHENSAKINSVKLYRQTKDIGLVFWWYRISKASLMSRNKRYAVFGNFQVHFWLAFDLHTVHFLPFFKDFNGYFSRGEWKQKSPQSLETQGITGFLTWPARRDSNPRSSESESAAISSFATGGYITILIQISLIFNSQNFMPWF